MPSFRFEFDQSLTKGVYTVQVDLDGFSFQMVAYVAGCQAQLEEFLDSLFTQ